MFSDNALLILRDLTGTNSRCLGWRASRMMSHRRQCLDWTCIPHNSTIPLLHWIMHCISLALQSLPRDCVYVHIYVGVEQCHLFLKRQSCYCYFARSRTRRLNGVRDKWYAYSFILSKSPALKCSSEQTLVNGHSGQFCTCPPFRPYRIHSLGNIQTAAGRRNLSSSMTRSRYVLTNQSLSKHT